MSRDLHQLFIQSFSLVLSSGISEKQDLFFKSNITSLWTHFFIKDTWQSEVQVYLHLRQVMDLFLTVAVGWWWSMYNIACEE